MRKFQILLFLVLLASLLPARAIAQEATPGPAAPILISPAEGATGSATLTFVWQPTEGADGYRFEISTDPEFSTLVDSAETSDTSVGISSPLPDGVLLYWHVWATFDGPDPLVSETRAYSVEPVSTATPEPTATETSTLEPTITATIEPTVQPTEMPSSTSTEIATLVPSFTPTVGETREPTVTRTPAATKTATPATRSGLNGSLPAAGYRLTGVGRSDGSVHPNAVVDRDLGTIWTSPATTPGSAYFVVSLDSVKSIGQIRWVLGKTGRADQVRISVSVDRTTWTEVGRARNSGVGEWQSLTVSVQAKYIRFMFVNIRGDRWLGGIVEVEAYAPVAKPEPTATMPPATPTPIADGIVRNASLEIGAASWYLENGVRVSSTNPRGGRQSLAVTSTGGYADQRITLESGTTYELTVWGSLTRRFDVGYVGIALRDKNGNRLRDMEPEMLEFTATKYVRQDLQFTVDSRVASANVYIWKQEGGAGFYVDDLRIRRVTSGDDDSVRRTEVQCQGLMVPGYFDPRTTGLWQETTATGSGVALVIFAPNSGVGDEYDQVWADVVSSSLVAGFRVLAYVQTDFGSRSSASVIAEMDQYRDWYGVTDFFLDEADTSFGSVERYRAMVADVHRKGGIAVLNFGWMPHPAYMEFTDIAGVFEDGYAAYGDSYERPAWFWDYPPERFLHIVHSTPASKWQSVIDLSRERNAGYVWVTDDDTESYYKSLPSFWTKLNSTVRSGC